MKIKKLFSLMLIICVQAVFLSGCTSKNDKLNFLHSDLPYNTPADQIIEKENLRCENEKYNSTYLLPEGETVDIAGYSFNLKYHFLKNEVISVSYGNEKEQKELDFDEFQESMKKVYNFLKNRYGEETEMTTDVDHRDTKYIFRSESPNIEVEFRYTTNPGYFRRVIIQVNYTD